MFDKWRLSSAVLMFSVPHQAVNINIHLLKELQQYLGKFRESSINWNHPTTQPVMFDDLTKRLPMDLVLNGPFNVFNGLDESLQTPKIQDKTVKRQKIQIFSILWIHQARSQPEILICQSSPQLWDCAGGISSGSGQLFCSSYSRDTFYLKIFLNAFATPKIRTDSKWKKYFEIPYFWSFWNLLCSHTKCEI